MNEITKPLKFWKFEYLLICVIYGTIGYASVKEENICQVLQNLDWQRTG